MALNEIFKYLYNFLGIIYAKPDYSPLVDDQVNTVVTLIILLFSSDTDLANQYAIYLLTE